MKWTLGDIGEEESTEIEVLPTTEPAVAPEPVVVPEPEPEKVGV